MPWYSNLFKIFKRRGREDITAEARQRADSYPTRNVMRSISYVQMASQHNVVRTSIDDIAENCAVEPLRIYTRVNGELREVVDHPLVQLLDNPNVEDTGFQLMRQLFADRLIYGSAYWFLAADSDGGLQSIIRLDPARVSVVPHPEYVISHYLYEDGGERIQLNPMQVVEFPMLKITSNWYADSPLEAGRAEIETDMAMARWNRALFGENVGIPAGIWTLPADLNQKMYEAAVQKIEQLHNGQVRTAIVQASTDGGGDTRFVASGLDHEKLTYNESRSANRQWIMERLGIPTGMKSEASTEAHARVAERRFNTKIHVHHRDVSEVITKRILPLYGTGFKAMFKDARTADMEQLKRKKEAMDGVGTVNEMRRELFAWEPLPNEEGVSDANSSTN